MQAKEGIKKMMGLQKEVPAWHKRLTERLAGDVHMVGPTISCEGTPRDGGPAAEWLSLPHVQSHAIAVDQVRRSLADDIIPCCRCLVASVHTVVLNHRSQNLSPVHEGMCSCMPATCQQDGHFSLDYCAGVMGTII